MGLPVLRVLCSTGAQLLCAASLEGQPLHVPLGRPSPSTRFRLTHPSCPTVTQHTLCLIHPNCAPQVLTCILDGLADEAEGVRDAALAAGRISVELYATTALPLLLPAVEAAIMSSNW